MSKPEANTPPDALLLLGTHCPHCPTVLQSLSNLVKAGTLGTLKVVNIEQRADIAQELGVRSVPWVRIGSFELEGLRSEKELRGWAEKAAAGTGLASWLDEALSSGKLDKPLDRIKTEPAAMDAMLELFADPDTPLSTRIGISAIMEELQDTDTLSTIVDQLGVLTKHEDTRIRGDACYYLSLSNNPDAAAYIKPMLDDDDANVREIARESLEVRD